MRDICKYCWEKPVARKYTQSCKQCVFICPECNKKTPYEEGHGDCTTCDACCYKHGDNHWRY